MAIAQVSSRVEMAALVTSTVTATYLTEAGREGQFLWEAGNHASQVTADPQQGLFVAPTADPTGASGAWVRVVAGNEFDFRWFGALADGNAVDDRGTDNTTLLPPALRAVKAFGGDTLVIPPLCQARWGALAEDTVPNVRIRDQSGYDYGYTSVPYQMADNLVQFTGLSGGGTVGHAYNGNVGRVAGWYHPASVVDSLRLPGTGGSKASFIFYSKKPATGRSEADWQMAYDRTTAGREQFCMASYGAIGGTVAYRVGGQASSFFKQHVWNTDFQTDASFVFHQSGAATDDDYISKGYVQHHIAAAGSTGSHSFVYRIGDTIQFRDFILNSGVRRFVTKGGKQIDFGAEGTIMGAKVSVLRAVNNVTLVEAHSGRHTTNAAASGGFTVTLPACTAETVGQYFTFSVDAAQQLVVDPAGTNNFVGKGTGKNMVSTTVGSWLEVVQTGDSTWTFKRGGTWTDQV